MRNPLAHRLDGLAETWNETEITRPSLGRWIKQFHTGDQPIALRLLECMQMHGWARLIRECRLLHERLCVELAEDGFDVERCSDIDFTRPFVCKSGDLISYLYRKANRLPVTCFHNIDLVPGVSVLVAQINQGDGLNAEQVQASKVFETSNPSSCCQSARGRSQPSSSLHAITH
jgi:hypothetical protein